MLGEEYFIGNGTYDTVSIRALPDIIVDKSELDKLPDPGMLGQSAYAKCVYARTSD